MDSEEYYSITTLTGEISFLHSAIIEDRISLLEAHLENPDLDVNLLNKKSETPLATAVKVKASSSIIQKLLIAGADPNIPDHKGDTPLHAAVTTTIVNLLLSCNSHVNAKNFLGETPLHVAKTAEIAKTLIEHGADVNTSDNSGNSPLHKQPKSVEISRILLQYGANINAMNINNLTPLHEALLNNHQETVLLLLENGAEDVKSDVSALHLAYLHRCTNRIKEVLWSRSKPASLVFVAVYDSSRRNEVLKVWSLTPENELMELLLELVELMEQCPILQWVSSARLVADFFISRISQLSRRNCRYFLWRFAEYLGHSVLNFMLRTTDYTRVTTKELEQLIDLLLRHGDVLDYSDLEIIFTQKGDCGLIHKLLKCVTVEKTRKCKDLPLFLRFLCDITVDGTLLINRKTCSNVDVIDLYNIHTVARYATLPYTLTRQFRHSYNDIVRFKLPELCSEAMEVSIQRVERNSGVPRLLELGRNVARKMLSKKFNLKSTRELALLVEKMALPKVVASVLLMEFPLYDVVVPEYTSNEKWVHFL